MAEQTVLQQFAAFLSSTGRIPAIETQKLQGVLQAEAEKGDIVSFLTALWQNQILDEEEVTAAYADFLNLPYIDLRMKKIPNEVLNLIPTESRSFYKVAPFEQVDTTLKVGVSDPNNVQALEALEFLGQKQGMQIQVYICSRTSLERALAARSLEDVVDLAVEDYHVDDVATIKKDKNGSYEQIQVIEDTPIVKIVDIMLANAIEANASDIHIEPGEKNVRVRYRIDGILHNSMELPSSVFPAVISRVKILSNLKIDEQRLPQDGRFHVDMKNRSIDFRVSTLPLMYGEKVVMRLLDKTTSVPTLEDIGLRGKALEHVKENIIRTHGIFLITGPTGSGKSTTLYSILSMRNTSDVNIVTLEDPIEYFIKGVNQSQVKPDIGLTFASGLRSILRQDPNIIMVGEIRDEETAELAVHAALTGHLVFSTLHTNNAPGAVPRLINMGIEPFLLSASMNLVMAQRLVRRLCNSCKRPHMPTNTILEEMKFELQNVPIEQRNKMDLDKLTAYEPVGCDKCGKTGYKGRIGVFEVFPVLPELQDLIIKETPAEEIYKVARKYGIITMRQDSIMKVVNGDTSFDEVARVFSE